MTDSKSPMKPRVAVLGPLGTYTHEATFKLFGEGVEYHEGRTIRDVFDSLSETCEFGVVPQENSIFGGVIETYDILRKPSAGFVCGELVLEVQHCLLVREGVRLDQIEQVMSHEQAIGQCSAFLKANLPNAGIVKMPSTASAAQALLEKPPNCAAICSKICATLFKGLSILSEGIQNEKTNFTRFYIITGQRGTKLSEPHCTTVKRGLLHVVEKLGCEEDCGHLTSIISTLGMPIARIDRRPSLDATPFRNIYFFEVRGEDPEQDEATWIRDVDRAVERARKSGAEVTVVGLW